MSTAEKYIILKLDEASAEAVGQPTVWVQVAEVERPEDDFARIERVLGEWLAGNPVTAAGEYLVAKLDGFRVKRFMVTPRVEFDVDERSEEKAGGLEVVA